MHVGHYKLLWTTLYSKKCSLRTGCSPRFSPYLKKPVLSVRLRNAEANPLASFAQGRKLTENGHGNPAENWLDREKICYARYPGASPKAGARIYRTIAWSDPGSRRISAGHAIRKFKWNRRLGIAFISLTRKASRNSCSSWCWSDGAAVLAPMLLTISTNSSKLTFPSPERKIK